MNILICDPIGQSGLDYLTKLGHIVVYKPEITPEEVLSEIPPIDALIVRSRTKVTAEIMQKGTSLKVIARSGAGVDTIDVETANKHNIVVVNAPGTNSEAVAEHTLALMLALARDIVRTSTSLSSGVWSKSSYRGMELHGKILGVIGFGHIGSRVAELAHAFGMTIYVYSRTQSDARSQQISRLGGREVGLDILLRESDMVTIHVSLSDGTRGMIDLPALEKMKPISYLINTSRGAVVDEDALISALQSGQLAGAALDVFASEPLAKDNPLCSMGSVILTPHVAASSHEAEERASIMIAEDIDRVLKGAAAAHAVTI